MVGIAFAGVSSEKKNAAGIAAAEAPEFEKVQWYSDPNLRKLYFWCAVLCVASATTGYDGMMLNTSQNLDQWQAYFKKPTGSSLGLMNAIYQIGSLASFPLVPYMADWWGRKLPIAVGCLLMILGGVLGAFSNGYGMYVGGRFILGFGNSLSQLSSPVLLTEICHPQHRGRVTTIYNCLWNLGALFVAWLAWATMQIKNDWSWRSLTLLQILPAVIQLTFIYWVPESPRWHISKDRPEEALKTLAYYHANGDEHNPTVQFEYQEIKETLRLEFEFRKTSNYSDFLKTKGNRYRLAILISLGIISQYSGNALFSNYMNLIYNSMGITKQNQKIPLNGGQTLLALVVSCGCALLVDRVGRRPLFLTSTVGMCVCFLCWTITASQFEKQNPDPDALNPKMAAGYPQVVFVWVFGVFYSLAWSGLLVAYSLEILPYKLRAKGLMIMNLTVQATLVLGNYTNAIAWDNLPHHWNLSLIYTIWIFVELCFVYFFYVETRGPTLEELAKIFDGDAAEVAHVDINLIEKELHGDDGAGIDEKRVVQTETKAA
ncbi:MFS general substrate transporter [Glarea lozoyensis ATCC 20868]|uniref:MFS general substrate transporter n=2 Tax=Glarea lozoyensis TaxID=101852 RepID=S3D0D2_GLAL2|nr:MFS general substrate transporter [Glarea lozoyensis ATCC 20868]EHK96531.1 putative Lactose permease [Glarea lozoyensis 74030]EPE31285.1 MFS general substrate transporter [Glarea lozoyensis ATCC 20868]